MEKLDVLILGAGPAGSSLGILLAKAGWSVGIVEKKQFPRKKVCGEFISATTFSLINQLGLGDFYLEKSGPEIKQVGFFAKALMLTNDMPKALHSQALWGRALGREHLDTALLNQASNLGVRLFQPGKVIDMKRQDGLFYCTIDGYDSKIVCPIFVSANGSWEDRLSQHKSSDLLAFKVHFKNTSLTPNLMPLIAFPGGYGGLVHTDSGRVSLSFCIRRNVLQDIRLNYPHLQAGPACLQYIQSQCQGLKTVLEKATLEDKWLACGPIAPGIRSPYKEGVFFVGNSAGEAHPIIAEGISMAMQTAWLLSTLLLKQSKEHITEKAIIQLGKDYTQLWHKHFANRIYVSSFFAQSLSRKIPLILATKIIERVPVILKWGADLSGKINQIVFLK